MSVGCILVFDRLHNEWMICAEHFIHGDCWQVFLVVVRRQHFCFAVNNVHSGERPLRRSFDKLVKALTVTARGKSPVGTSAASSCLAVCSSCFNGNRAFTRAALLEALKEEQTSETHL
jgi:hypothetical protein